MKNLESAISGMYCGSHCDSNAIQMVTGIKVITENFLPFVRKMFPLSFALKKTFYESLKS